MRGALVLGVLRRRSELKPSGTSGVCRPPTLALWIASLLFPGGVEGQQTPVVLPPPDAIAEERFTRLTGVRELSDDRVLGGDKVGQRLFVVDFRSGTVSEIGRNGEGPGEYIGIGELFPLAADSTLFVDLYLGRWNLLNEAEIVHTRNAFPRVVAGQTVSGADHAGRVLVLRPIWGRQRTHPDTRLVILADRSSDRLDTVAALPWLGRTETLALPPAGGAPPMLIGSNPLAAADDALLFSDGWIAIARVDPYRVDWVKPDGTWIRGAPLPVEPVEVDQRERCHAIRRMIGSQRPCASVNIGGWPSIVPPFIVVSLRRNLLATPEGHLLVHRASTADHPGNRYDVIDRSGRLRAVLRLPANVAVLGFGDQAIYTVLTGEFDLQVLRRHRWRLDGASRLPDESEEEHPTGRVVSRSHSPW